MKSIAPVHPAAGDDVRRLVRRLSVPCLILVLGLGITGCGEDDPAPPTFPTPQPQVANTWLYDVQGTGADDIYACGDRGAMFRYSGGNWTRVSMGTSDPIIAIWGPGDNTLYAVGHGGRIWTYSGSSWSSPSAPTDRNLYGVGEFNGQIYAAGHGGMILRRSGSSWTSVGGQFVIRDENAEPLQVLSVMEDIVSLVTVNHYGIAGAYLRTETDEETDEVSYFPDGGILGVDIGGAVSYPWQLRTIKGNQLAESEWVLCNTSSSTVPANNFLGTSEGWLFKLTSNAGVLNWVRVWPDVTSDVAAGIRDMWMDAGANLYMVTDEGTIVYQPADYPASERVVLYDQILPLLGIWGADASEFFVVGMMDATILRCSHDQTTGDFTLDVVPVDFPDAGKSLEPGTGPYGRPLF